jgi:hypothetical protein
MLLFKTINKFIFQEQRLVRHCFKYGHVTKNIFCTIKSYPLVSCKERSI